MIKGVRLGGMGKALSYLDKLTVPIIENTPFEEDLKDSMALVRRTLALSLRNSNRMQLPSSYVGNEEVS